MAEEFGDARLEEIKLLSQVERQGELTLRPPKGRMRDMVADLVWRRLVNDLHLEWPKDKPGHFGALPYETEMERQLQGDWLRSLYQVLSDQELTLKLTHKGRVRLSELKQELRGNRIREQYGILWDGRHLEPDLRIAILEITETSPLSIGFLDMNGLKTINDRFGHSAGETAVRAYFHAVATALSDRGQGYGIGGDEVIVVLPSQTREKAVATVKTACQLLMAERLRYKGQLLPEVSLAVGVATTTDPAANHLALKERADREMYRAKKEAHKMQPSPSAVAISDQPEIIRIEHPAS